MQQRREQEPPAEVRSLQGEDDFRLWAAGLSNALQEAAPIINSGSSNGQKRGRNGTPSKGATTDAAPALEDDQLGDEDIEQEYLLAVWRRVSLQREQLRLEQDAMRQAVENLRLRTEVQARRIRAARNGQTSQEAEDERVFWYHAEEQPARPAREEVQGTIRADHLAEEPTSNPAEQTGQRNQLWPPRLTPHPGVLDSDATVVSDEGLMMLLPNPEFGEAPLGGARGAFATGKRRIIRYSRRLWRRLT